MRKVRHKNVVQFIGACTRKPNLCIVFEFMSGGSVYDYIRKVSGSGQPATVHDIVMGQQCISHTICGTRVLPAPMIVPNAIHGLHRNYLLACLQEGPLRLSQVLKTAVEVSRGMDYLHQRKIVHRDLKAANLLLDDHQTVKVSA